MDKKHKSGFLAPFFRFCAIVTPDMDEQQLIAGILTKNERALFEFYRGYTPQLKRFIQSKIDNPHDVEDVLQDTLYAFLDALRDFRGNCQLRTFLQSICRHKIIDFYRKKKMKQLVFSQIPELEELVSPLRNPEQAFDERMMKEELQKTLNKLIPQYKTVLYARYMLNMPVSEIAKKLAITLKSAESMLFRAKKAFAKYHVNVEI